MRQMSIEFAETFEDLRARARAEVDRGDWNGALETCAEAIAWAEQRGDHDDIDLAHCNRSGILIDQGRGQEGVSKLRQILLSSSNPKSCFYAAYHISRLHELRKETQRGLFYAQLCLEHAERTDIPGAIGHAHNRRGNLLIKDSYFEEACSSYREALQALPLANVRDRAVLLSNIGYCQLLMGYPTEGFRQLFRGLRLMRTLSGELWELLPRLGLAAAYLDVDRPERARRHADRGLALAEAAGIEDQIKNGLYLLGESEKLCGNETAASEHFQRLQDAYYPGEVFVADFLMTTDVSKLINLMA